MLLFWGSFSAVALSGYHAVVVENATVARVIEAMMQQPQLQYWTLAGHGEAAGAVAARLALTLHPKVKALVLLAAALPEDVSLVDVNLLLVVVYGSKDTVVPPATVEASFSRMEGMYVRAMFDPGISFSVETTCYSMVMVMMMMMM
jgi:hypothetical protein